MNTKTGVHGWRHYGESPYSASGSPYSALVSGVLPARGIHFLVVKDKTSARAVVADLAVAVAAGHVGCGLSEPDAKGKRHDMAGFFGLTVGAPKGVAVVGGTDFRGTRAASLARGVTSPLPIAFSEAKQSDVVGTQIHRMRRETAGGVALVILAADFSGPGAIQAVVDYRSDDYALLVVAPQEPPSALVEADTHVLRVTADAIELVRPESINGWRRGFTLEAIRLISGEAQIVRPDRSNAQPPIVITRAEPIPAAAPEPEIAQHVILALGGYGLHPGEAKRWPAGAIFVRETKDAVAAASAVDGVTQITLVQDHATKAVLHIEQSRLESAIGRDLEKRVIVKVSDKQLLDPYCDAA
ncbi:hypothetical protein [Methylocystis parvus]|uniref:Uncharacterized protein n=1 Tax=Methylocystis parvus TaxID=134 RepID=A0A6B8M5M6_9HYPH|nr:hypothetical protein [Methylocystis parvus]QGM97706.1 hypothetical protein F7D14_09655 [Methylocystis parvus]WBJ98359.1 hypothetical protein MMG94_09935 [Methylocystis parvus OBBP]